MARLLLVDTADQLPGLLPLHAWTALMASDLVLVGSGDHPFVAHLELQELRVEVVAESDGSASLSRADLLSGLAPSDKRRAEWVVDRVRQVGEVAYLFGPSDAEAFTRTLGMEAARAGVEVEVVYFGVAPKGLELLRLVDVQTRLRAPGGCPWDAEQTHASLARYAVEETYELLEAISDGEPDDVREELGDVLLQVVFHAQIAQDGGGFTIDDVARGIIEKLVRRHSHVFADAVAGDSDGVLANWEALKAAEKPERTGVFDGVVAAQPAVAYATKLQQRAARTGFDWPTDGEALQRVRAELDELSAADEADREAELGDLLLSVVGVARRYGLDPELALRSAATRFRDRVAHMLGRVDGAPQDLTREQWLALWDDAKQATST